MEELLSLDFTIFDTNNFASEIFINVDPLFRMSMLLYSVIMDELILIPINVDTNLNTDKFLFCVGSVKKFLCIFSYDIKLNASKPNTIDEWFDLAIAGNLHKLPTKWLSTNRGDVYNLPFNVFSLLCGLFCCLNKYKKTRSTNLILNELCLILLTPNGLFVPSLQIQSKLYILFHRLMNVRPEVFALTNGTEYFDSKIYDKSRVVTETFVNIVNQINTIYIKIIVETIPDTDEFLQTETMKINLIKTTPVPDFSELHLSRATKQLEKIRKDYKPILEIKKNELEVPEQLVKKIVLKRRNSETTKHDTDNEKEDEFNIVDPFKNEAKELLFNCSKNDKPKPIKKMPPYIEKKRLIRKPRIVVKK